MFIKFYFIFLYNVKICFLIKSNCYLNQIHFMSTDFVKDFLIGGVSAAVSKTAVAPIERVKLLL